MVTPEQIANAYPVLFHMAAEGSWPGIQTHGLLSTSALLDLFAVEGQLRKHIEEEHRPESVPIVHPVHGSAIVRDQKPMDDRGLLRALPDEISPRDWYRTLNSKVFFWVRRTRLETMMGARAYRAIAKTILHVSTAELLGKHAAHTVLAPMNTGCTKPFPHPRGNDTFLSLDKYPYEALKKKRREAIVELAVEESVPDIADHVLRVEHVDPDGTAAILYQR